MSVEPQLQLVDGYQPPDADEIDRTIEYIFGHRKEALRGFLSSHALPVTGKKETMRARVVQELESGRIRADELIGLLDSIEGWGNQHIYLYEAPAGELTTWKSEAKVRKQLERAGIVNLFNRRRPLVLPEEPTLSSIEWTPSSIRFIWVEKREWELRLGDLDTEEDGVIYKAYRNQVARGITAFDWDLVSGHAALMIQRLPSGENYDEIRQAYEEQLEDVLTISNFERVAIRRGIRRIESSSEALNRQIAHETKQGNTVSFTSKSRKRDVFSDPDTKKSRNALGPNTASVLGNFYWLPKAPRLERNLHVKSYARDLRVGIFGECTEGEVKYVLSRVRHHSK